VSHGYLVRAELRIPDLEAWRALRVDPRALEWEEDVPFDLDAPGRTVGDVLAALASRRAGCDLTMTDREGTFELRTSIAEDAFLELGGEIATAIRLASQVLGRGRGVIALDEGDLGYRLDVEPGRSACVEVDAADLVALLEKKQPRAKHAVAKPPVDAPIAPEPLPTSDVDELFALVMSDAFGYEDERRRWEAAHVLFEHPARDIGDRALRAFASADRARAMLLLAILAKRRHAPALAVLGPLLVPGSAMIAPVILAIGTEDALALLESHLESADNYLADAAVGAVFTRDPTHAWDRLAPYLAPERVTAHAYAQPAASILGALERGHTATSPAGLEPTPQRWLEADPRWNETLLVLAAALAAPCASSLPLAAVRLLARTGDQRATPVLAGLFGTVDTEEIADALRRLGDPAALDALRAELARARKERTRKTISKAIAALEGRGRKKR
jgi:hypothetical protein